MGAAMPLGVVIRISLVDFSLLSQCDRDTGGKARIKPNGFRSLVGIKPRLTTVPKRRPNILPTDVDPATRKAVGRPVMGPVSIRRQRFRRVSP